MRWRMPEGRDHAVMQLQTILQGGLYGSSKRQDQEEGTCKEESRQEKEVGITLSEAIH